MNKNSTRKKIIEAADNLFYRRGYEHTSFADIAHLINISRGNLYHHFKFKDDILKAVIDHRSSNTQNIIKEWETLENEPAGRIKCYIRILSTNWDKIRFFGCPVGTLCSELTKLEHPSHAEARAIFSLFRTWLRDQFILMEYKKDADTLALQVLAWSQGVATLSSAFQDQDFVRKEISRMCHWIDSLTRDKEKTCL